MSKKKKGRTTTGSVQNRGAGQWRARVLADGKRHCKTFDDRASAEDWLRELTQASERDRVPKLLRAQSMTLSEALTRYVEYECPAKSREHANGAVERLLRTEEGFCAMAMADIDESDIDLFIQRRLKGGVKPATVNADLATMGRSFVLARTKWGCTKLHNPTRGMKLSANNKRVRRFRRGEEAALLFEARKYESGSRAEVQISLLIRFAANAAMRLGELARMDWEHVNFERATVYLSETKNGQPRTVAMAPGWLAVLRELGPKESGVVWGAYEALHTAWRRVRASAAKECPTLVSDSFRFHDLRHEAVSRLFEQTDLSDGEIATITGHRSPQSLWRYRHLRADRTARKLAEAEASRTKLEPASLVDRSRGEEEPADLLKRAAWKTISRDSVILGALVQIKPITTLAKDYGISDVAIHKACARLGVVKAGRGRWLSNKPRINGQ